VNTTYYRWLVKILLQSDRKRVLGGFGR